MQVDRPNSQPLTPEETKELERLRKIVEQAAADGVITKEEAANIKDSALGANPSYELLHQEMKMYRELISQKIDAGLLQEEE